MKLLCSANDEKELKKSLLRRTSPHQQLKTLVKEGKSKEDAVAQVFSEELLPFLESASLPL
jgi:hypothetical protein